jgi:hypothetical protein
MTSRPLTPTLPILIVLAAAPVLVGGKVQAQPAAGNADACGAGLSEPIRARWLSLGGAQGRLGCPTSGQSATAASPQGTRGEQIIFSGGTGAAILRADTGPHAGQMFAIDGCTWRLYFQYGGSSGWLGFPTSEASNTPDGKRQAFEGGDILYQRAPDTCVAERAEEIAGPAARTPAGTSRLDLFEDAQGRREAIASAVSAARARNEGYQPATTLAFVYTEPGPGLLPLKTYSNPTTGDHDTIASADSERADLAGGYEFDGLQGYVWSDPRPGTVALKRFWNAASQASLLTADPRAEADAIARGYVFSRIEGYAPMGPLGG